MHHCLSLHPPSSFCPDLCIMPVSTTFSSHRAHPRSGSVQTSPTGTPMSSRRGRQLPQLPPTGKDRSKSPGCPVYVLSVFKGWLFGSQEQLLASEQLLTLTLLTETERIIICCWNPSVWAVDRSFRRIFLWFMFHWCFLLPSIHNVSTRFLFHSSLRRWRRRNRALWRSVPECVGLVFQTGGAAWDAPRSEGH